jgi:hypothetical protein
MKRIAYICALLMGMAGTTLLADQVASVGGAGYGPYQTGVGGEFTLQIIDNGVTPDLNQYLQYYADVTKNQVAATPNFQTFCVEGSEYIYPNATYNATVGQMTLMSGTHLSVGAAYLYYQFATGALGTGGLPGYNYNPLTRTATAGLLQNAIWYYMGQESQTYNSSNPYENWVQNHVANPFADNTSLANPISVSVLNLWAGAPGDASGKRQDQLILTGKQGFDQVPDGGLTAALLGIALAGLGVIRRRIQK